jgi:hypothetical protein
MYIIGIIEMVGTLSNLDTSSQNNITSLKKIYSERQKYGINSLKIKQNFFQKNLWTGQF